MRSIVALTGVAVLCVGGALFVVSRSEAQVPEKPVVQAWEYKVVDIESLAEVQGAFSREEREKMGAELEKGLNRLGAEGWEFAFEIRGPMVFKRPK